MSDSLPMMMVLEKTAVTQLTFDELTQAKQSPPNRTTESKAFVTCLNPVPA